MTYCLGILTAAGLVVAADSRTNAGVDHVSTQQKLFDFSLPGKRTLLLCVSGNLSTTQSTLTLLRRDIKAQAAVNLHTLSTLYEVTRYIGDKMRLVQDQDREWLARDGIDSTCNFLVGGQVEGEEPGLFLVYSQGNCIQASRDTPFLQIGETKYGKPILDRVLTFDTSLGDAAKCALLSIDSTMKSNISVGPPIDLVMYETGTFKILHQLRLDQGDPYLMEVRHYWEAYLKSAFDCMPDISWERSFRASHIEAVLAEPTDCPALSKVRSELSNSLD
jgi:putative proteasome-type protease